MENRWIVEAMIILLSFSVVMIIWPGMRRFITGFVRNAAMGLVLLWLAGSVLGAPFAVGLNILSGSVCGLLGLPGTALLLILKRML